MYRSLILAALFSLLASVANAACPSSTSPTCGDPMQTTTSHSVMYATAYGVKADGVTSDDVALKAAIDACAAKGTKLILPPGRILLTGAATSNLKNCHIEGAGVLAGKQGDIASMGTLFLLTSTTVKPFTIESHWKVSGAGFYWPNQTTGTTVYPFLMSPATPSTGTTAWTLDNVTIVNAYNGVQANGGAFFIQDSLMYAVNELFEFSNIGDSFKVNNVHFTPGPWFNLTNFAAAHLLGAVTSNNIVFRFMGGGTVPVINMQLANVAGYAWRYGIVVESGVAVAQTSVDWQMDATGTILETRPGGQWASGNTMRGSGICRHEDQDNSANVGNAPCFKFAGGNNNSNFNLNDFAGTSVGSFIENDGANITLNNVSASVGRGPGPSGDGADYYLIRSTQNYGGLNIHVKDSSFSGVAGGTKTHGIKTTTAASRITAQNNGFIYFNDVLDVQAAPTTIITGNWMDATTGAESIVSATLASSGLNVTYANNQLDKPTKAVATACGAGCVTNSVFSGFIQIGTGTVTSGTLTLPWASAGSACNFWLNGSGPAIAATVASPRAWNWTTAGAVDVGGRQVFYACPVQ